jgi:hypothetical protein
VGPWVLFAMMTITRSFDTGNRIYKTKKVVAVSSNPQYSHSILFFRVVGILYTVP